MQLIDAIYSEMKRQIIDNQQNQIINYPEVNFTCLFNVNMLFI